MVIGEAIKQARLSKGISQKQLSCLTGLSQAAISYIESGSNIPTLQTVELISSVLGVELNISEAQDIVIPQDSKESVTDYISKLVKQYGVRINTPTGTVRIPAGRNVNVSVHRYGLTLDVDP